MRDLSDGVQPPWDGDQYIETARHVGQFNNLWTEQDRPKGDWITTDMSTDRRASVSQSIGPQVESLTSYSDHPSVERLVEGIGLDRVLRMPDDIARIIESTHDLPRTVAHNDLHARNLFSREENGERITYAIDWASVGPGPVGVDGGSLAGAGVTWVQLKQTRSKNTSLRFSQPTSRDCEIPDGVTMNLRFGSRTCRSSSRTFSSSR